MLRPGHRQRATAGSSRRGAWGMLGTLSRGRLEEVGYLGDCDLLGDPFLLTGRLAHASVHRMHREEGWVRVVLGQGSSHDPIPHVMGHEKYWLTAVYIVEGGQGRPSEHCKGFQRTRPFVVDACQEQRALLLLRVDKVGLLLL